MSNTAVAHPGTPPGCERIAYAVGFQENATYSDVYGGGGSVVGLDCHLIRPVDQPSDTLIVFMHPVGWWHVSANGAGAGGSRSSCLMGQLALSRG